MVKHVLFPKRFKDYFPAVCRCAPAGRHVARPSRRGIHVPVNHPRHAHARCADAQLGHAQKSAKADEKPQINFENWKFEAKMDGDEENLGLMNMEICSASLERNGSQ